MVYLVSLRPAYSQKDEDKSSETVGVASSLVLWSYRYKMETVYETSKLMFLSP
jgi:hypothetical protein